MAASRTERDRRAFAFEGHRNGPRRWAAIAMGAAPMASERFPLRNPAIVSMPAAFLVGIVASLLGREPTAEDMFDDEKIRTYLGVGAE